MDPQLTLLFVVLFGLAGICFAAMVLIAWLRHRRLPRTLGKLALLSTAMVMISLGAAEPEYGGVLRRVPDFGYTPWLPASGPPRPTRKQAAEQARVDEMHREFAPALERYRTEHGTYPPTLAAAGIGTPMTRYGPLYYYGSGSKREPWYLLSFGDIETYHFSMDWDSRAAKWTLVQLDF